MKDHFYKKTENLILYKIYFFNLFCYFATKKDKILNNNIRIYRKLKI